MGSKLQTQTVKLLEMTESIFCFHGRIPICKNPASKIVLDGGGVSQLKIVYETESILIKIRIAIAVEVVSKFRF